MSANDSRDVKAKGGADLVHAFRRSDRGVLGYGQRGPRRLFLAGVAFRARRTAELRAIASRGVRRRLEAARGRDVDDRHRGLQQQLARAAQTHLQVVALGHAVEMTLEQALDLAAR